MEYFVDAFKKAFDFQGRANRTQYWMFYLAYFVVTMILEVVWTRGGSTLGPIFGFILAIWFLVMLIPSLSIAIRRLRDAGKSPWWILIVFLPFIGWIWLIILLVLPTKN